MVGQHVGSMCIDITMVGQHVGSMCIDITMVGQHVGSMCIDVTMVVDITRNASVGRIIFFKLLGHTGNYSYTIYYFGT